MTDLRICCSDSLSYVWVFKNGTMSRVVKFFGLLIIGAMGAIICRIGSQGQVGVQTTWFEFYRVKCWNGANYLINWS